VLTLAAGRTIPAGMTAPTRSDLVLAGTFNLLAEAEVARSVLAAHGIAAVIQDRGLASMLPPVAFTTGGVRILVAPEDVGRAQDLLSPAEAALDDGGDPLR
jgi:hypothetical protein